MFPINLLTSFFSSLSCLASYPLNFSYSLLLIPALRAHRSRRSLWVGGMFSLTPNHRKSLSTMIGDASYGRFRFDTLPPNSRFFFPASLDIRDGSLFSEGRITRLLHKITIRNYSSLATRNFVFEARWRNTQMAVTSFPAQVLAVRGIVLRRFAREIYARSAHERRSLRQRTRGQLYFVDRGLRGVGREIVGAFWNLRTRRRLLRGRVWTVELLGPLWRVEQGVAHHDLLLVLLPLHLRQFKSLVTERCVLEHQIPSGE